MRNLTKNLRRRAALLIALAYAFCVMAPAAALAIANSPGAFHCVADLNAASAPKSADATQTLADGTGSHHHEQSHDGEADHHSDKNGKSPDNCCGLFCTLALTQDAGLVLGVSAPASSAVATLADGLTGRAPGPLHRPPIA